MSFVDHRCATCGHIGYRHLRGGFNKPTTCTGITGNCTCTELDRSGDVEIVSTFLPGTSTPTPLMTPGETWNGAGTSHETCACEACRELAASAS